MSRLIDANEVVKDILAERDKIPMTVPTAPYELGTEKPYHAGDQMRGWTEMHCAVLSRLRLWMLLL